MKQATIGPEGVEEEINHRSKGIFKTFGLCYAVRGMVSFGF
jgi:hypothetical protein